MATKTSMTRAHYALIAKAINDLRKSKDFAGYDKDGAVIPAPIFTEQQMATIAGTIASHLVTTNTRFDFDKFYKACGFNITI